MQTGFKFSEITKDLDVHRSTIYREISCNRGLRGYRPQEKAVERKKNASKLLSGVRKAGNDEDTCRG